MRLCPHLKIKSGLKTDDLIKYVKVVVLLIRSFSSINVGVLIMSLNALVVRINK